MRTRLPAATILLTSSLLAACSASPADPAGADSDAPLVEAGAIAVSLDQSSAITTVPTLSFSTAGADEAWIELSRDGFVERIIPVALDDDGAVTTPVLGMKPSTTYELRVFEAVGDRTNSSDPIPYTTGALPSGMPNIDVDGLDPDDTVGGFLVTSVLTPPMAVILDRDGDYVWWYRPEGLETLSRAVLARDGASILMGAGNVGGHEGTDILRVSLDGSTVDIIETPDRHHDFVERTDGTIAYIAYDPRTVEGVEALGDKVVEVHPDGTRRQVYSVWDYHTPTEEDREAGVRQEVMDWPHANAIELVDDGDAYLVSFLQMDAIAKVDRDSGDELWMLGGPDSTLARADGSTDFFDGQHGMDLEGDRLMVFSNELSERKSAAIELRLQPDQGLAEETWRYSPDPALQTIIMGDVQRLDGDRTMVTFSYNGQIHELDADGQPTWILSTGLGGAVGYTTWTDALQ